MGVMGMVGWWIGGLVDGGWVGMVVLFFQMGVSKNRGTPKSSILIEFSIINHPFWGTTIFGNTQMLSCFLKKILT